MIKPQLINRTQVFKVYVPIELFHIYCYDLI